MLSVILIVVITVCAAVILVIIWGKLGKISAVNYQASKAARQVAVKRRLLEERLQRKLATAGNKLSGFLQPLGRGLSAKVKSWYQKAVDLEESYRHKILRDSFKDKVSQEQHSGGLLAEAEAFFRAGDLAQAEKKFIEVLELDQMNIAAYQGLGELYLEQEDYDHARQTLEFLLKLDKNNASAYRDLAQVQVAKGDLKSAEQGYVQFLALDRTNINGYLELAEVYLQLEEPSRAFALADQASGLEPGNPKVLDFLIEVSIITRDRQAALKAWRMLKEVNPENQKLDEFKSRIDKL